MKMKSRIDIDLMKSVLVDLILYAKQKNDLSLQQIHKSMIRKKSNHEREFREFLIEEIQTMPEHEAFSRSIYFDSFKRTVMEINCSGLSKACNSVFHELIEEERQESINIKHNQ